ncbi:MULTISPECIES: HNH endonuclease signature motif containing protein [unclassified Thioalkalivibrio]|uniref:HNH endonuclease signature motif containing protein n=1 Tax=unclassified Thioalkalivibrio TaxID=2621013 RepID=UPI0003747C5F|nr:MULTISPECIES: HNH endonuclease signature motif containing protein [unclassified Thioalkalivibrio]
MAKWTEDEDKVLRGLYPGRSNQHIAWVLGRSESSVSNRAVTLGLSKSPEYLASGPGQFRPGQTSWNKGKRHKAGGRSAETRFKPGRAPSESPNYKPIGSTRVTRDGILERKVTDSRDIVPARRWVPVARLVWEEAHGPVPEGHAVVFRQGMHTTVESDITPDRLECIPRSELMRRNSFLTRYPKEIADVIRLRGALKRQINRRESA